MLADRIAHIRNVTEMVFTGKSVSVFLEDSELDIKEPNPNNKHEGYILAAMWVMMVAEFEGSIKELVEDYIEKIKLLDISEIHACILWQNFVQKDNQKDNTKPNATRIIELYNNNYNPKDISAKKITGDFKPRQSAKAIAEMFHALGVYVDEEDSVLKKLDAINSTRNQIAHSGGGVDVAATDLNRAFTDVLEIYQMLEKKLNASL